MKIALAQINPTLGNVKKNKLMMIKEIEKAIDESADIIVFSELCLTGYLLEEMVYDVAMKEAPEEFLELSKSISIVYGGVEESLDHYLYNTAYFLEDGEILHRHRKVYLPTYGLFVEGRYFAKGDRFRAFDSKHGRLGMLICEDAWHTSSSYILTQDGATTLLIITNSPARGITESKGLEISKSWESINVNIAVNNSTYVVFSHRTGYEDGLCFWGGSEIVDPLGEVILKLDYFDEKFAIGNIDGRALRRARMISPILKDEDLDLTIRELERIKHKKYK